MNWITDHLFQLALGISAMYWLWSLATRKKSLRKIADQSKQSLDTTYHSGYRYQHVELASFRYLDAGFYEGTTEAMKTLGFERVADVEYLHVTEGNPDTRTCVRVFASNAGDAYGAAFQIRIRGWKAILLKSLGGNPNLRIIEFNSSLSNGHVVMSGNTGNSPGLSHPDEVHIQRYPFRTPPAMLLDLHRQNLGLICDGTPESPTPVPARTLEEIISQEKRQHEIESRHRMGINLFTKEELRSMKPDLTEKQVAELIEKFEETSIR